MERGNPILTSLIAILEYAFSFVWGRSANADYSQSPPQPSSSSAPEPSEISSYRRDQPFRRSAVDFPTRDWFS